MEKRTKQLVLLVGAIFVALIFLSSYLSFSNNNTTTTTSTSIKSESTFYATGVANALITNYSQIAFVYTSNSSNATRSKVDNLLSNLELNGTLQNYVYTNTTYQVILASISAYNLQQQILNVTGGAGNITVGSSAQLKMPSNVTLFYTTYPVSIEPPSANYSVFLRGLKSPGSTIEVQISALLTTNGGVYQNQFRVTYP